MSRSSMRLAGRAAAAVTVTLLTLAAPARAASVPTGPDTSAITARRIGDLTLVDANRRGVVLQQGASATEFSVDLPKDSSCPGDSENDNWRIQTFVIPAADDPATIAYDPNGPTGEGQFAIYDATTNSIVDLLTTPNGTTGLPGRIPPFLGMSFGVFTADLLPPGSYRIGVACTWFGATASYWDTPVEIVLDAEDRPGGFVWRLPDAPDAPLSGTEEPSSFPFTGVFLGIAAAALGFVVFLNRRAARTSS